MKLSELPPDELVRALTATRDRASDPYRKVILREIERRLRETVKPSEPASEGAQSCK